MVIRNTFLIVVFILLMPFTSCDPPEGPSYAFSVTASISPSRDTVSVGDTLYLESSFPTKLPDNRTGKIVDYSNSVDLSGSIGFADFNKFGTTTDSTTTKYMHYVVVEGDVYNDKSMPVYWNGNRTRYEEKDGYYKLKIGMIPQKKGMYQFSLGNPFSNGQAGHSNRSASFTISFVNTEQHLHYYEDLYGQFSYSDRVRTYCFVVK
ncbi:MAG TPA: hypothetical protein VIM65_10000 [Cyclobacteriaceae bacterium]